MSAASDSPTQPAKSRSSRRLSDTILVAFHQACDQADFEVAEGLLKILEMLAIRPIPSGTIERRSKDTLVAAHERLWHLQHPDTTSGC
jgi:hypothetical protein